MKNVSDRFKQLSKNIKRQDVKLTIKDNELTVEEINMVPANIFTVTPTKVLKEERQTIAKELKYSFDGKPFKTIMQQIEITVKNAGQIKDKNINFQYGILIDDSYEYVDMGDFFIKDIEDSRGKKEIMATGYDNMIKFMRTFKQSELQLTYPCKMSELTQRMGEVCGVELYSTNFFNSDLDVDEDFFTSQDLTYRDVLEKVTQATLTTAFIKENKLYFCKLGNETVDSFDTSFLSDIVINEKFGPVNALVLGRGDVEDNIESKDDESISTNGRCEIRFDENELVEYKREKLIDNMFEQIKGLEYYFFESSNIGIMWLEPCDFIELKDREENTYKSYYFKASITINTGIKGGMEAGAPSESNTEYKVTTKEEKKTLKVERLAKKNEGLIQDVVQEIGTITGSNSIQNGDFSNDLQNWMTSAFGGTVTVKTYNNKKYANLLSMYDTTVISQIVSGLFKDIEYTLEFDIFDDNPYDISVADNAVFSVTISQNVTEEETETVYTENIQVTETETRKKISFKLNRNSQDVLISFNLKANGYLSDTASVMIRNIVLSGGNITEKLAKLNITADEISNEVAKKVNETEFGTKIEQNWESIKYAWNQISQYLKMEGLEGKATLNIYDENNILLMSLDQEGQHFYKDGKTVFGEMGVNTIDNQNYISFGVTGDYEKEISDGMAWGITTKSDNKFWPILYIKNFSMGPKNSDAIFGELILSACNLVLDGIGTGIKTGGVLINGDPSSSGLYFWDENTNKLLLGIYPENILDGASITILDNISFWRNSAGSNSFRVGNSDGNHCLFTDDGSIYGNELGLGNNVYIDKDGSIIGDMTFYSIPTYQGNKIVYGESGHRYFLSWTGSQLQFWVDTTNVGTLSDKRLKAEIQDIDGDFIKAIEEIEMKQFKVANRNGLISFGILAQDLIEIFKKYNKNPFDYEIVYKTRFKTDDDTIYYAINYEQFLILKQKATDFKIQEQQTLINEFQIQIKQLQEEIKQLKGDSE